MTTFPSEQVIKIPTGYLFTTEYSKGPLETLSIGDYGKPFSHLWKFDSWW